MQKDRTNSPRVDWLNLLLPLQPMVCATLPSTPYKTEFKTNIILITKNKLNEPTMPQCNPHFVRILKSDMFITSLR
jgi:hypothetical protein